MELPLIISSNEIIQHSFPITSPFYPHYIAGVANASPLDVATAIGKTRKTSRPELSSRLEYLKMAAQAFKFSTQELEHAVHMTGMPISVLEAACKEIPYIFRSVPETLSARFNFSTGGDPLALEAIAPGLVKILRPFDGYCYAVTPGLDPRASAIVSANLACLGIPFILRASPRDAVAASVVRALVDGGFDPGFCSLVYLDKDVPDFKLSNFKLVDAASIIWTFGPPQLIDPALRFELVTRQAIIDLPADLDLEDGNLPANLPSERISYMLRTAQIQDKWLDHFRGKFVLRHNTGNCAIIAYGPFNDSRRQNLFDSLNYPIICTATKSAVFVNDMDWVENARDFLTSLKVGDPLDPTTQVGYIDVDCLNNLQELLEKNLTRVTVYGGERISSHQAAPLLVTSQEPVPDFFSREIPAYVLAARGSTSVPEAVDRLNDDSPNLETRLAVALLNVPEKDRLDAALNLRAHKVLIDKPTSRLLPSFHEGNDYTVQLTQGRMLVL